MAEYSSALKADLYELTMAAGYYAKAVDLKATFELFCYKTPSERSYFVACGLEQIVEYLLNLRFSDEDIGYLKSCQPLKSVSGRFFDYLKSFRFTGDLWAMPEGQIFFPLEPVIQVRAPIIEAQIIETYLISMMHIQTLVATKASRIVSAASSGAVSRGVVDFGSRRAHGPEAAILAARAAYIGGCAGTSNVWAGARFGIPTYGTMAHSWVEAFDTEEESFVKYRDIFPEHTILLIDTYDTAEAARKIARMKSDIRGVRIDSGDLAALSKQVRRILDGAGLANVKIMASGNLNEYKILELIKKAAPIDMFGVGTEMVTSKDMPALDLIYKLVQTDLADGRIELKAKSSQGKRTMPGRKRAYRTYEKGGIFFKDHICLFSEKPSKAMEPLLEPVIVEGKLAKSMPSIGRIRSFAKRQCERLPAYCADIHSKRYLKTEISPELRAASRKLWR